MVDETSWTKDSFWIECADPTLGVLCATLLAQSSFGGCFMDAFNF